ncbi:MAG: T9SS type A sorting domain-containing protein [Bacteroidota bacterium]
MKNLLLTIVVFFKTFDVQSQIISHFDWDNNPVTQATVGPDAASVSSSAIADINGANDSNGLNPGTPKKDINLTIPASSLFDVEGIDVKIDYQREENQAFFFERGEGLKIEMNSGNISIGYRVQDGLGGFLSIASGNIYNVPYDDLYRTYQFSYDPNTGTGTFLVDGTSVWRNDGPDNRNLFWNSSDDVIIGRLMDGSGRDKTCLDNLVIERIPASQSQLPVELENFTAALQDEEQVGIEWTTVSEKDNDFFTVERSADGVQWEILEQVSGAGNSDDKLSYHAVDQNPLNNRSYYRLRQTDFNGTYTYSKIVSVFVEIKIKVEIFPNPATQYIEIQNIGEEPGFITLHDFSGQVVRQLKKAEHTKATINVSDLPNGIYLLQFDNGTAKAVEQIMISH